MGNPSPKRRLFHGHWVTVGGGWAGGGTSTQAGYGARLPASWSRAMQEAILHGNIDKACSDGLSAGFSLAALVIGGMGLRRGTCTDDG